MCLGLPARDCRKRLEMAQLFEQEVCGWVGVLLYNLKPRNCKGSAMDRRDFWIFVDMNSRIPRAWADDFWKPKRVVVVVVL